MAMLAPGKGTTQRAYLWAYASARSEALKAVVYDFTPSRSGEHARAFLGHDPQRRERDQQPWSGHLVCDDFSGYKALFAFPLLRHLHIRQARAAWPARGAGREGHR